MDTKAFLALWRVMHVKSIISMFYFDTVTKSISK